MPESCTWSIGLLIGLLVLVRLAGAVMARHVALRALREAARIHADREDEAARIVLERALAQLAKPGYGPFVVHARAMVQDALADLGAYNWPDAASNQLVP
jgi:hypothetical protein